MLKGNYPRNFLGFDGESTFAFGTPARLGVGGYGGLLLSSRRRASLRGAL